MLKKKKRKKEQHDNAARTRLDDEFSIWLIEQGPDRVQVHKPAIDQISEFLCFPIKVI